VLRIARKRFRTGQTDGEIPELRHYSYIDERGRRKEPSQNLKKIDCHLAVASDRCGEESGKLD
jgi:hypothetical protein